MVLYQNEKFTNIAKKFQQDDVETLDLKMFKEYKKEADNESAKKSIRNIIDLNPAQL